MAPIIERIVDIESVQLGEGPHWDQATQTLYFVDIFGKSIHKYIPSTKKHTKAVLEKFVSLIIPLEGSKNKFLVSLDKELAIVTWDGESTTVSKIEKICEVDNEPEVQYNRLNDGKCDSSGRFWAGTIGIDPETDKLKPNLGSFFSLENKKVTTHFSQVGLSNGLAFDDKLKKFYFIDSLKLTIDQFDFDVKSGKISNRQEIFSLSKHNIPGLADGMCIDADGNLWIAIFDGYRVIKIDPRKPETLLETIQIPAKQVTSVAFGGSNLDELYVTTGSLTMEGIVLSPPDHGSTYKISGLGVKGLPGVSFKW